MPTVLPELTEEFKLSKLEVLTKVGELETNLDYLVENGKYDKIQLTNESALPFFEQSRGKRVYLLHKSDYICGVLPGVISTSSIPSFQKAEYSVDEPVVHPGIINTPDWGNNPYICAYRKK